MRALLAIEREDGRQLQLLAHALNDVLHGAMH
jgi:hypothetical protein